MSHKDSFGKFGDLIGSAIQKKPQNPEKAPIRLPHVVSSDQMSTAPAKTAISSIHTHPEIHALCQQLLNGQMEPEAIQKISVLHRLVSAVVSHYRALSEQSQASIQQLEIALQQANEASQTRDTELVRYEQEIERYRELAQNLGQQATMLRAEYDALFDTKAALQKQLDFVQADQEELKEQLDEWKSRVVSDDSERFVDFFQELVTIEIPELVGKREALERRIHLVSRELKDECQALKELIQTLKEEIDECHALSMEKTFTSTEQTWHHFLDRTQDLRATHEEYEEHIRHHFILHEGFLLMYEEYQQIIKTGAVLQERARVFVTACSFVGVDLWKKTSTSDIVLEQLKMIGQGLALYETDYSAPCLSSLLQERYRVLNQHIHRLTPKQGKKKEKVSLGIQLMVGQLFLVDPDSELERLCAILLSCVHERQSSRFLSVEEMYVLLRKAKLIRESTTLPRQIAEAMKNLIQRGIVRRVSHSTEGVFAFQLHPERGKSYVKESLSQVQGANEDILVDALKKALLT